MKYKFEGSDEVHEIDMEEVGNLADTLMLKLFGQNSSCKLELIRVDYGVYVMKKTWKEKHVYDKKKIVVNKLKRRWHPTKDRVYRPSKYLKYLKL